MLKRLLALLPSESAGDLLEEYSSGRRSRVWLLWQIVAAALPSGRPFASYWNDVRYSARALAKNPGFATIAIGAIALGIGVNTGIFTVLNGIALKRLPAPGSDRLVSVYQQIRGSFSRNVHGNGSYVSTQEYEAYRDQNHVFSGLAAYSPDLEATLAGRKILGQLASCNYFDVLNEPPAMGRALVADDCRAAGAGAVAVLSDSTWRDVFGSDPNIVGRRIVLSRQPFTVVGVAKAGFTGTEILPAALWVPITIQHTIEPSYDLYHEEWSWLALVGRAKSGVSIDQIRADLGVIAARIDQKTGGRRTALDIATATLVSMPEERMIVNTVGGLILAAVGMVLLIACANVANLLLARGIFRQREIAIRLSVGATRWRLIRQLLTESMLIAVAGGALGSAVAVWGFQAVTRLALAYVPLPPGFGQLRFNLAPDWRVLTYALALTLITGVVFGLVPALRASRPELRLKSGGRLRNTLVGAQVAVCMVLLIAAGLLLRGLWAANTVDPGFQTKNIASISFQLQPEGYSEECAAGFQRRFGEQLKALPGIESAVESMATPLGDARFGTQVTLRGETDSRRTFINKISPEFFSLVGIPIVRGRNLTQDEVRRGAALAIVTESTARRFWPGQDPLGKSFKIYDAEAEVIGVARDAQVIDIGESDSTYMYLPAGPKDHGRTQWMVRYAGKLPAQADAIRAAARSLDPDLVIQVEPLEQNLEFSRSMSRIVAVLAGSLGGLALLLASIGIYGVVSFAVSRRVREIGIRMALGADRSAVRRLILTQSMWPVGIGAAAGIAICAGVSKLFAAMLFGISPHDALAFSAVPAFLVTVALLASYVPARRATQVDPVSALRHD